jgi:hypothetical protein
VACCFVRAATFEKAIISLTDYKVGRFYVWCQSVIESATVTGFNVTNAAFAEQ